MTADELLALFRSEVDDAEAPYLWSTPEVYGYIDDAQKMFCRLYKGIPDATSGVTKIAVKAGEPFALMSPLILKVGRATMASDGSPVQVVNYENLDAEASADDYGARIFARLDDSTGPVRAIVTNMEPKKVRLVQIPLVNDTINLVVQRLPRSAVSAETQELEINDLHHRHLGLWVKHLAYSKNDAETVDRQLSERFRAEFTAYCDQARREQERREHKSRVVTYGGI